MNATRNALIAVLTEREKQDEQWGGPSHDDEHTAGDWWGFRQKFEDRAMAELLAALALAQLEALERDTGNPA